MTEYAQQLAGAAWEVAGRRVASSLDGASSALVIGEDAIAAASAALGIARVQAARRRVAVADLIGEVPPLQELVSDDDAHGISDSFQFGISLTRVAHQVDEAGSLFILPSGTEPVITEEVLRSERWRLLADSYRKAGALLLLVAPPHAPGVTSLARFVNGVVLAGDVDIRTLGDVRVLTAVAPPPLRATESTPNSPLAATPLAEPAGTNANRAPKFAQPASRSRLPLIAGGVLAAAAIGFVLLSNDADGAREREADGTVAAPTPVTTQGAAAAPSRPVDPRDTVSAVPPAAAAAVGGATGAPGQLLVINPGDSARAAHFTVLLSTFPSAERARVRLEQDAPDVPAATLTPAGGGPRYQYVAGAYATRAQAESLLTRLRRRAAVGSRGGSVVERPLAFLVREGVPRDSVGAIARDFRRRRLAVYPLMQPDGSARLYTGAYESVAQATPAAAALRTAGIEPTLAYRTGSPQ